MSTKIKIFFLWTQDVVVVTGVSTERKSIYDYGVQTSYILHLFFLFSCYYVHIMLLILSRNWNYDTGSFDFI